MDVSGALSAARQATAKGLEVPSAGRTSVKIASDRSMQQTLAMSIASLSSRVASFTTALVSADSGRDGMVRG
jgi:hypothetical protein